MPTLIELKDSHTKDIISCDYASQNSTYIQAKSLDYFAMHGREDKQMASWKLSHVTATPPFKLYKMRTQETEKTHRLMKKDSEHLHHIATRLAKRTRITPGSLTVGVFKALLK